MLYLNNNLLSFSEKVVPEIILNSLHLLTKQNVMREILLLTHFTEGKLGFS